LAYIGVQPAEAYTSFAVQHFTTSATTSYTLDNPVANENEIALFINNVRQEPGSSYAYTASGTTLTLSAATSASDTMYCVFIGKAVQTVTPASGSVTNDMLAGSIANAKLANSSVTVNGTSIALGSSGSVAPSDNSVTMAKLSTSATEGNNVKQRVAKAWVNFNGTGTVAIRDDFNVSSITDNSTGEYVVNLSTALANSNYAFFICAGKAGGAPSSGNSTIPFTAEAGVPSTSAFNIVLTTSAGSVVDRDLVTAIAFGESA